MEHKKWEIIGVIATVIMAVVAVWGVMYLWPGNVIPATPTQFGFIRDYDSAPSDLIVLTIIWENQGGQDASIENPYLILRKVNTNDDPIKYIMVGDFDEISGDSIEKGYLIKNFYLIDPHSRVHKNMVFRIKNWWDENDPARNFKFKGTDEYDVSIGYSQNFEIKEEIPLFRMPIYGTIDSLDRSKKPYYWFDFFSVERSMIK